jgi:hypothetical protein
VEKLIYLGEKIFFCFIFFSSFFSLSFCFWGFIICAILSISLSHERKFSYLVVLVTLKIMKDLENLYGIFLKLTLLYFMHGWSVQMLVSFGVKGGEDNMHALLWQILHVVIKMLEVFLKGPHLPLVVIFFCFFPCSFL